MQKCAVPSLITVLLAVCVISFGHVFGLPHESSFRNTTACQSDTNCTTDKVCFEQKCSDPCVPDFCGKNTFCYVANHNPICCGQRHIIRGQAPMFVSATQAQPQSTTTEQYKSTTPAQTRRTTSAKRESTTLSPSEVTTPFNFELLLQPLPEGISPSRHNSSQSTGWGSESSTGKKKFYLNTVIKMNWHQAWAHCRSLNLDLASLDSNHEYNELYRIISQTNVKEADYWLSGSDLGEYGDFLWMSTGRPVSTSNWQPGEPNHHNDGDEVERCIALNWGFDWKMNDNRCSRKLYHVCQSS